MKIKIKRVYEKPDKEDGIRILVDRLWPRGLTTRKASVDLWLKDVAPTTELRKWLAMTHQELKKNKEQVSLLKEQVKKGVVTLVYGAKDEVHNEALVLKERLNRWP